MDSLAFYDIRSVAVIADLDVGDTAPASSDDTMLRVVNTSDLYQANDVTVTVDGADAVQLWLSTDGDTFTASIDVGDIQPGGSSLTFWLRRVTPSTASTGPCTAQLSASPTAWVNAADTSSSDNIALETD